MPMGIVDKEELADEVAVALSDWTAARAYEQESGFQDDLHAYLDARLNAGGKEILDTGGNFVVDRTDGELECDVVVSNTIGIAVFQDLTASRIKRLDQQIEAYLKAYTHVIIIACGSTDDAAWENLRDSYEGQQGMNNDPGSTPVMFLRRFETNYGKGDSADNYDPDEPDPGGSIFQTIQTLIQSGLQKLR